MGRTDSLGVHFGPTANGKEYVSVFYHRGPVSSAVKSKWIDLVTPSDEYAMFEAAEAGLWSDRKGNLWSVRSGGAITGKSDERIAKHPIPSNEFDEWHGYPASPALRGIGDSPDDDIVETWLADGLVDRTFARRLQRWRI